jgi:hypothetical protein
MKKLTIAIAAVATLTAGAAAAQPWMSINDRQARLEQRIDQGIRSGQLNRHEAMRLRHEMRQLARLEYRYRRTGGLSGWERADLDRRFDQLSAQVRFEKHDAQQRYGMNTYRHY